MELGERERTRERDVPGGDDISGGCSLAGVVLVDPSSAARWWFVVSIFFSVVFRLAMFRVRCGDVHNGVSVSCGCSDADISIFHMLVFPSFLQSSVVRVDC